MPAHRVNVADRHGADSPLRLGTVSAQVALTGAWTKAQLEYCKEVVLHASAEKPSSIRTPASSHRRCQVFLFCSAAVQVNSASQ